MEKANQNFLGDKWIRIIENMMKKMIYYLSIKNQQMIIINHKNKELKSKDKMQFKLMNKNKMEFF